MLVCHFYPCFPIAGFIINRCEKNTDRCINRFIDPWVYSFVAVYVDRVPHDCNRGSDYFNWKYHPPLNHERIRQNKVKSILMEKENLAYGYGALLFAILYCWNLTVLALITVVVMIFKPNLNSRHKRNLSQGDKRPHEEKEKEDERICMSERQRNHPPVRLCKRTRDLGEENDGCKSFDFKLDDDDDDTNCHQNNYKVIPIVGKFKEDRKRRSIVGGTVESSIFLKIMDKVKTLDHSSLTSSVKDLLQLKDPLRFVSHSGHFTDVQVNFLAVSIHPKQIHGIPWERFNNEYYRLISFVSYPKKESVSTIMLASKGFAYSGNGMNQEIICCFCTARMEGQEEMEIDDTHKNIRNDCPMVLGVKCNNVSMDDKKPRNEAIFHKFLEFRQSRNGGAFVFSPDSSIVETSQHDSPQASQQDQVARSSQPMDESAASAIVTNSTDLEEADSVTQNSNSTEIFQSSHELDPSRSVSAQQVDRTDSSARVSAVNASTISANATPSQTNEMAANAESDQVPQSTNSNPDQANSQSSNEQPQNSENSGEATNYEKLGIITARPKRPEYAVFATRMASFNEWPKQHHMKPKDLALAGYFYTGYSDCARCFYCGGGLRNWEQEDDVWVEHARWFPKCAFLLQEVGIDFINTVTTMSGERDDIKYDEVIKRMQGSSTPSPLTFKDRGIERDPAVLTVVDNGYDKDDVCKLALENRKNNEILSSEKLFESAKAKNLSVTNKDNLGSDSVSIRKGGNDQRDKETIETLRNENSDLRQQTICKICMDMDVAVVFLPCGHFVSCTECSCALTACPLCRVGIKGIVRAYMG